MKSLRSEPLLEQLSRFNDSLGWSQRVRSLDYFRCLEYQLILSSLASVPCANPLVLEWGIGTSPLPHFLSRSTPTLAMDLDQSSCAWQARLLQRRRSGTLTVLRGDGLKLPVGDDRIDVAIAVGALEHALETREPQDDAEYARDCGDSRALCELGRVLRPGGVLLLTVPWSTQFSYSQASAHTRTFERRYDDDALERRLVLPSGLKETDRRYFGEPGLQFSRLWYRLPFVFKLPFRRLIPSASRRFVDELSNDEMVAARACGVFLRLEKPLQPPTGADE